MCTEEDMTFVRKQFKRDGMESLIDLAEDCNYKIPCVRFFLLHRNQWLNEIGAWAKKIADNCDFFLPVAISACEEPQLFQDIQGFESKYNDEIKAEIRKHPMHFSELERVPMRIEPNFDVWVTDRKNKGALDINNPSELQLVNNKIFEFLEVFLRDRDMNLSSLNDCNFIRNARRILTGNPKLVEHLNACVVSQRAAIARCNSFFNNLCSR